MPVMATHKGVVFRPENRQLEDGKSFAQVGQSTFLSITLPPVR
jgi:hypothetical protein